MNGGFKNCQAYWSQILKAILNSCVNNVFFFFFNITLWILWRIFSTILKLDICFIIFHFVKKFAACTFCLPVFKCFVLQVKRDNSLLHLPISLYYKFT